MQEDFHQPSLEFLFLNRYNKKDQALGTAGTAADALEPEAFDIARTRRAPGATLGLAYLTNGLERIEAGGPGFARAATNGVSNIKIRGAATPPPPPPPAGK